MLTTDPSLIVQDTAKVDLWIARLGVFRHEPDALPQRRRLVRETVARHLNRNPEQITVSHTGSGQPQVLRCGNPIPLAISTASCRDVVVIALATNGPVGVDVQAVEDEHPHVQQRALTPAEFRDLHARPGNQIPDAWMAYWTRKEALLKGLGVGIRVEPATVPLPPLPQDWDGRAQAVPGGGCVTSWGGRGELVISLWTSGEPTVRRHF